MMDCAVLLVKKFNIAQLWNYKIFWNKLISKLVGVFDTGGVQACISVL